LDPLATATSVLFFLVAVALGAALSVGIALVLIVFAKFAGFACLHLFVIFLLGALFAIAQALV
jgi:hypothetical protein